MMGAGGAVQRDRGAEHHTVHRREARVLSAQRQREGERSTLPWTPGRSGRSVWA